MTQPVHAADFRRDIQGLRAIAVGLVLVFHIWPQWLPGGYVGVDVFFVISGYLITSLLYRELARSGTISLPAFYARRVRRLLPAASLVLLATALATVLLAPRFKWLEIAHDIVASAFYVQNWRLAANAVDYLAAEEAIGPLKHFWSLAIEEQYYIVWPVLLLGLAAALRARPAATRGVLAGTAFVVALVSLYFSIRLTVDDPAIAYFASHTRVWELALGALLALMPWQGGAPWLRALTGWLGVVMMLASAMLFTKATAFPGYAALLPTLGAALALWSGGGAVAGGPQGLLSLRPMQFFGDISYSLYLWHWPLIVFTGYALGHSPDTATGFALLAASVLAAWSSKRYVEDGFRALPVAVAGVRRRRGGAPAIAAIGMGACLVAAVGIVAWVQARSEDWGSYRSNPDYPGALALTDGAVVPAGRRIIPSLEVARLDLASSYGNYCHQRSYHVEPKGCDIGHPDGKRTLVLVGDSHAANWIPAFEELGTVSGWRVLSYTKSACALTLRDVALRGKPYPECTQWSRALIERLREVRPDVLVMVRSRGTRLFGLDDRRESNRVAVEMYEGMIADLRSFIPNVVVLRDTPRMAFDAPECLAGDSECRSPRSRSMAGVDPLYAAAGNDDKVRRIDMTDAICGPDTCDAVVGNVLVWRDRHHLTATYARTLAPELSRRLDLPTDAAR